MVDAIGPTVSDDSSATTFSEPDGTTDTTGSDTGSSTSDAGSDPYSSWGEGGQDESVDQYESTGNPMEDGFEGPSAASDELGEDNGEMGVLDDTMSDNDKLDSALQDQDWQKVSDHLEDKINSGSIEPEELEKAMDAGADLTGMDLSKVPASFLHDKNLIDRQKDQGNLSHKQHEKLEQNHPHKHKPVSSTYDAIEQKLDKRNADGTYQHQHLRDKIYGSHSGELSSQEKTEHLNKHITNHAGQQSLPFSPMEPGTHNPFASGQDLMRQANPNISSDEMDKAVEQAQESMPSSSTSPQDQRDIQLPRIVKMATLLFQLDST